MSSNGSHICWKKFFHRNPSFFRIHANFEADDEIHSSNIGDKTINIYKQNPVPNVYRILSELDDILQNGYHKSRLEYINVDWFVDEVIKIENKLAFYFKSTNKDFIIAEENEVDYRNKKVCRFCKKYILLIK